mmetsp:Transcript_43494/g.114761  ORF Transcript_43494/g.114761 Transcript_43494/m.114761 type:complete len:205 (+) Transcript_43494:129-743(+)
MRRPRALAPTMVLRSLRHESIRIRRCGTALRRIDQHGSPSGTCPATMPRSAGRTLACGCHTPGANQQGTGQVLFQTGARKRQTRHPTRHPLSWTQRLAQQGIGSGRAQEGARPRLFQQRARIRWGRQGTRPSLFPQSTWQVQQSKSLARKSAPVLQSTLGRRLALTSRCQQRLKILTQLWYPSTAPEFQGPVVFCLSLRFLAVL